MAKAAMNEIWGTLFSLINMACMAELARYKGRVRFRVMVTELVEPVLVL